MPTSDHTPKSLTADRLESLLQMQKKQTFSVSVFLNVYPMERHPSMRPNLFTHIKGLLYKHITDSGQKFLALVIPKSWKYIVLVEAHDKL